MAVVGTWQVKGVLFKGKITFCQAGTGGGGNYTVVMITTQERRIIIVNQR
jgi:hypothetical protein